MKKSSVLTKRAALFTATVMAVTVAVSMCGYFVGTWIQLNQLVRQKIKPQAEYLSRIAVEGLGESPTFDELREVLSINLEDEARMLSACGEYMWLMSYQNDIPSGMATAIGSELAWPPTRYWRGESPFGTQRINGKRYILSFSPIDTEPNVWIGVSAPVEGLPLGLICGAVAALLGAALGALAGRLTIDRFLRPAIEPIARLRDAAVAMADGHLDTRADDKVPGELGELGKALNHLADQLSRNLYMLIVERNRLRNMLNGLSEGIVAIDADKRVTHTNPALGRLVPKGQKLHYPDPRMKTIPDAAIWADFDGVMETGEPLTRNVEGKDVILRMTVTPIVDEIDANAGAVGLFSDVTQMERLERTRREYVSNVNHELRTPLTAMRALIEPLKEGMVTEEADRQRYYDIILREIMRLSRLINDQLELSRLQSGTLSIEKTTMKIDDLVYDVCDRYSIIAREHGLKLRVNTDFSECPAVYTNADRLEQMLILLLDNAIKYTEKGSVSVSARWDDEKVVMSVNDTGIGIAKEDLPYVFDRFYKVDKAHSGKGSGLGLSIAKELMLRMGEDIRVTSEQGKGTQFSFTIHREPPSEPVK